MSDFNARYAAARKAAIARDFAKLNPEQRRGVLTTEGALLLLARYCIAVERFEAENVQ